MCNRFIRLLALVCVLLFSFSRQTFADTTATASLSYSLSAASFSGTVSSGLVEDDYTYAVVASAYEAYGNAPYSPVVYNNGTAPNWTATGAAIQISPGNYASTNFDPTGATTLYSQNGSFGAGDAFLGIGGAITVTDGVLEIAVPYTFSVDVTGGCQDSFCPSAGVGLSITAYYPPAADACPYTYCVVASTEVCDNPLCTTINSSGGVIAGSGEAVLETDVPNGTYLFSISATAATQSVPEPSTFVLCCVEFLCWGVKSIRKHRRAMAQSSLT